MTATVASGTERPPVRHPKTHLAAASLMKRMSFAQVAGDMRPAMATHFAAPRYRARLERRFLRRSAVLPALPALLDGPAEDIVSLGADGLLALIIDTGALCQYAALRRIVDREALAILSDTLGLSLIDHEARNAARGTSIDLARRIASPPAEGVDPLAAAILRDGYQAWTCWIHAQDESLRGFFRMLTPAALRDGETVGPLGCGKRDCRLRADLFGERLVLAIAPAEDAPVRKEA